MPNFSRKTVVQQVADAIEAEINSGKISGLMPSIRVLADRYNISVPTLHKARKLLVRSGLLVSRGQKRRLSVQPRLSRTSHVRPEAAELAEPAGALVIFCGQDPVALPSNIMMPVQAVMDELASQGRACVIESLAGLTPVEISRRISAVLALHKPTHCLLIYGTMVMHRQLARARLKVALIGGNLKPGSYSTRIGVCFPPLIERAVTHLKALGHRRFFVPFLRRDLGVAASQEEIRQIAHRHGVRITVHWSQLMANDAGEMESLMDSACAAGVTAVLFPQWSDYVFAMGYASKRGLSVPGDYSVVVLNNVSAGFMYRPKLAHFYVTLDVAREVVLRWVSGLQVGRCYLSEHMLSTWTPGETVGPAPKVVARRLQQA